MEKSKRFVVIMAGGSGKRFWPMSTSEHPKQLLSLVGDKPLIAQAVDRVTDLMPLENIFVITNANLVEATREAAPQLPAENVVGEPIGRDTAAAVACGAALVKARDPEGVFSVLTADHVIRDKSIFHATLSEGMNLAAKEDILITVGIQPDEASTGFGYIEAGESFRKVGGIDFKRAARFVEKPDQKTAEEYLESGRFYWNSGMFIWSAKAVEKAFASHTPVMADLLETLAKSASEGDIDGGMAKTYPHLEKISIDYALMEKADNIIMVPGTFSWDDVGSWPAISSHFEQDESGNTLIGDCQKLNSSENIVVSKDRLTALVGVDNLIVVQAKGVTMVCDKDSAQDVKKMVAKLQENGGYTELL